MAELIVTEEAKERVVLIGIQRRERDGSEESLTELGELLKTAGAEPVGRLLQPREAPDPGTYFGKGKVEELRELLCSLEADAVAADDELSPAQMKNLSDALGVKVVDRTMIILDIFAQHAVTAEGKLQVELAQLHYTQAHLLGVHSSLSRLGGGVGTRGPGEQKLELDRRAIRARISFLRGKLGELKRHREVARAQREKNNSYIVALVGYTNAGKSTLLNRLTDAGILAENKLFATLDPTTRKLVLPGGEEVLVTDTVGFIRKLPHQLIEAFHSTLEEARYADLILHVVDASSPEADTQMAVVYETLRELKALDEHSIISVYNKMDLPGAGALPKDIHASSSIKISAKTGAGIEALKELISAEKKKSRRVLEGLFPYAAAGRIQGIRRWGKLLEERYETEGIYVRAEVPAALYEQLMREQQSQSN